MELRTKFDLDDPEQVILAQEYMKEKHFRALVDNFKPRDEILEQLMICKEIKVSYESLEQMDYLTFEIDFKYANIMLRGIYDKAMKDQEESDKKRQINPPVSNTQTRVMEVEKLIAQHNL